MLACLIARKTGECQTIARVRSPQYSEEIGFLKEELGLSMSVNPESAAAHEMLRLDAEEGDIVDWDFLKNMDPNWNISAEAVPYMNCVNYWRRFETNFTGKRFFDLKRWGMEYYHVYGNNTSTGVQNDTIRMTWNDPRRALEIPQDAIAAGMEPSQPTSKTTNGSTSNIKPFSATTDLSELLYK